MRKAGSAAALLCLLALCSCVAKEGGSRSGGESAGGKKRILVSYSILGSLVADLVGDSFEVSVSIPDGLDPHDWEPSARDIEALSQAALVVENGLGLEEGMAKAFAEARKAGRKFFTASDFVAVRRVGKGEGIPSTDPDQALGARDPHIWTDPVAMKAVVDALADAIKRDFGVDLSARRDALDARLVALDAEVDASVAKLPVARRVLVTGHESLGYFAERYGFKLVGALVPSLSSQAESSAAELSALKKLVEADAVSAIFAEAGSSPQLARSLAADAGVKAVALATHSLPEEGGYAAFLRLLAGTIVGALKP
jgi:zinc/manganese transport system substrate-binding protein